MAERIYFPERLPGARGLIVLRRLCQLFAHAFQVPQVRVKSLTHGGVLQVSDVELTAGFLHELTDVGIMHMADAGKQVVLYLEIQPP
jgi:hypothetical protein